MEFMDGNEKSSNSFDDVYQLQGWKDGKPVQALQSHQGQGEFVKAGLAPDNLDLTKSADHPETLLRFGPQDQLQRLADATLGGRDCAVFLVETTKGKAKKTRRIWVEKATALPLRVEVALAGAPMVKAFTALVDFQRSPDGVWGPGRSSIALTMSILFKTIQMKTSVEFTEWSKRP